MQNYRPEKILFARAVKLRSFRKLGRETGLVCEVRDQGFGFVRSYIRDFNIFFRLSEVITEAGGPVREGDITVGCSLSFDVAEETRGAPSAKLRAVRVQLMPISSSSLSLPSLDGLSLDPESRSGSGSGSGSRTSPPAELEQAGGGGLTLLQVHTCPLLVNVTGTVCGDFVFAAYCVSGEGPLVYEGCKAGTDPSLPSLLFSTTLGRGEGHHHERGQEGRPGGDQGVLPRGHRVSTWTTDTVLSMTSPAFVGGHPLN